jgi:hypothetical protein
MLWYKTIHNELFLINIISEYLCDFKLKYILVKINEKIYVGYMGKANIYLNKYN